MHDLFSTIGIVATEPNHVITADGMEVTSFRLASSGRRFDSGQKTWVDTDTNWFSVVGFRQLAAGMAASLHKGDSVLVDGRLQLKEWKDDQGRKNLTVDLVADAIGHNLRFGTSSYTRNPRASVQSASPATQEPEPAATAGDWGAPALSGELRQGEEVPF
ncbi:MAG: single-strand DNA-binding protein [Naasia sp.]|jgi:single-strand DNA-binding protein|uniref:single-stranded DNA-binding protein n=1 Tax=Naasia sp. TaxID=2546198 RepID=UPI002630942B|nr:single-stranded DNA-binding protein [Naasia sp.]MCU1569678.1 single-strand DNA-binding protein [Naasia sp.]